MSDERGVVNQLGPLAIYKCVPGGRVEFLEPKKIFRGP